MRDELRIFVPRLMDGSNTNAQNLNARALLSRFTSKEALWSTCYYNPPEATISAAPRVKVTKLWRTRLWQSHLALEYQQSAQGIFYPGIEWFDEFGLAARKVTGRRVPVIGTLEGLVGDELRERRLEALLGHKVHCHRAPDAMIQRMDRIYGSCDHLIAITPMLAKTGRELYGDKVSMVPLGVDGSLFNRKARKCRNERARVITVATLTERKRPFVMLEMAKQLPDIDFVWYGTGPLLLDVQRAAANQNVANISFPGGLSPSDLASEYARSDLFVLPSLSEGAPKALQEAAACSVPAIAFGFYEPEIVDGHNGFIVWDDVQLRDRIEEVCQNRERFQQAAANSKVADWDTAAPQWEQEIISRIELLS